MVIDAYGIIGLNSKGSANKGFLKLSPILFSPQMRLMIDLRRKHAQNEDLSAKRSAACNSGSTVSDEEGTQPIGMWGRKHLRYIKENRPVLHTTLLLGGKLNSYLAEIDNRAAEMFERLMKQLTEQEGITEQLKAQDQMAWVGAMNSIRNQAEEIINAEIIYT